MIRRQFILGGSFAAVLPAPSAARNATPIGIIFLGASWCPYCKRAAPILAGISQRARVPVLVASFDDRPIDPFPDYVSAHGHPLASNVRVFPTTVVMQPRSHQLVGRFEGFKSARDYAIQLLTLLEQGSV